MGRTLFGFYTRESIPKELKEFLGAEGVSQILPVGEGGNARYPTMIVPGHIRIVETESGWNIGPVPLEQSLVAATLKE